MGFIERMMELARQDRKRIVLPESGDSRVLQAADAVLRQGLAEIVLIGKPDGIKGKAEGLELGGATIVDPETAPCRENYVQAFYELRRAKGVTLEQAAQTLLDPVYFATMMVKMGDADGMVSGAAHSTADTVRPALQILKTRPGTKLASSFFVMDVPNRAYGNDGLFVFADCGLMENPTAEELCEIAAEAADSYVALIGGEPRVAMLSYSTYGSAKSEQTEKVRQATGLVRAKRPELAVDGELQADAAIVPAVARSKAPGSAVAGQANVLVFPDLSSGNIAYKLVQRLAGAGAYGPILQGIARPVNDLSRGCSAEDIVGVVAITAVQAQKAHS